MKKEMVCVIISLFMYLSMVPCVLAIDDYLPRMSEKYGQILLDMRWRYEHVNQDGLSE